MARGLTFASYAFLGSALLVSRLVGLGRPYCCDEILTVTGFVREGPGTILAGTYIPNNHELYSLLGWATTSLFGESEVALRLLSVVPFVVGVVIVTAWLHSRLAALSGVLYLFLATASPLLVDTSRQARGYGLAFLAMSVLIVAALEAERTSRTSPLVAFFLAGVMGTWVLPHFAIAFFSTGLVLLFVDDLRSRCTVGLLLAPVAVMAWYLPHLRGVLETPRQNYGAAIQTGWLVTAPVDQTLVPAFTLGDDAFLRPNLASTVLVAAFVIIAASSPLLRARRTALILCIGTAATVLAAWLTGAQVVPRFFSFLLSPLLMVVATGAASVIAPGRRAPKMRAAITLGTLLFICIVSAGFLVKVIREPRESLGDVAAAIRSETSAPAPVFAYMRYPADLVFHLGRPVVRARTPAEVAAACEAKRPVFFVRQRWLMPDAALPCADRPGVRHRRFEQYARGGTVDVWFIPPGRPATH